MGFRQFLLRGLAKYHAPRTLVNRLIHIQVLDEADPLRVAVREIRVVPGLERNLMNWVMGPDWDVPKMNIYAGDPEPLPGAVTTHFGNITGICPIDDPAMPEGVNHHLAVADVWGIQLVSMTGEIRPWLGARVRHTSEAEADGAPMDPDYFSCLSLATRPRDSRPGNPYHLFFAQQAGDVGNFCVFALEPDGRRRLVAGGAEVGFQDGPGLEARFSLLGDMVMDRDGNIFLLDRGNQLVRRISPTGMVTTIAGQPGVAGQGRNLFIADSLNRSVRVWDLEHRTLHTLCGDPSQFKTRRGALSYFSPGRPPAECAAFSGVGVLAFSASGMLLVGTYECVAELDMPRFVSPARLAHPEGAESKDHRHGPAAPPPLPAAGTL
jgi:hypothetical protein